MFYDQLYTSSLSFDAIVHHYSNEDRNSQQPQPTLTLGDGDFFCQVMRAI
jgi:hypothetical protein